MEHNLKAQTNISYVKNFKNLAASSQDETKKKRVVT